MEKLEQVKKVSNPQKVFDTGRQYGLTVYLSPNPGKKYAIHDPTGKIVNFGDLKYMDYTHHLDEKRRANFLQRNAKWKDAIPYSPAWASYYLLWN